MRKAFSCFDVGMKILMSRQLYCLFLWFNPAHVGMSGFIYTNKTKNPAGSVGDGQHVLTDACMVTTYGDRHLGQHLLRQWLVAWRRQTIAWTNIDLLSRGSNSSESNFILIAKIYQLPNWFGKLRFHNLKLLVHLPWANECEFQTICANRIWSQACAKPLSEPMLEYF